MLIILLGIVSSVVAEVVTAINKRLSGTVLKGDGAFLVAFGFAFIGAAIKEITLPGFNISMLTNYGQLVATFTEVFSVSQVYFLFVTEKLGLDVQPTSSTVVTTTVVAPSSAGAQSSDKILA